MHTTLLPSRKPLSFRVPLPALPALAALAAALLASPATVLAQPENIAPQPAHTIARPEPIFNGRDLSGWWGAETENPADYLALTPDELTRKKAQSLDNIHKHWRVEDAELINDGHGLYLTTDRLFGDFHLMLEYRTVAGADSGIYLRGYPQVQIWDTSEAGGKWNLGADKGSGGLWNNSPDAPGKDPLRLADAPFGHWNALEVIMIGERVTVMLNGHVVVDHARLENYFDRSKPLIARGPIQLQTHGGEIRFRNIAVREISPHEANMALLRGGPMRHAGFDGPRFEQVFNGLTLAGWAGDTDSYEVVDRAIRCLPGKGGTIYTEKEWDDFEAKFEFLLPPGGNNGLAIRYPGAGDTAYVGMCELQILDDTDPKYARLDPRQYHGSAYGMTAAHRGYLRPVGQWNVQWVRVVGSRITVELNGTQILDADLGTVTDFMGEAAHYAGRSRTRGHFGFAGHNDPVAFRSIEIRAIETGADAASQPR